jgi:hypothetical protein
MKQPNKSNNAPEICENTLLHNLAYPIAALFAWLGMHTQENKALFISCFIVLSVGLVLQKNITWGKWLFVVFVTNATAATYLDVDLSVIYQILFEPILIIMGISIIALLINYLADEAQIMKTGKKAN